MFNERKEMARLDIKYYNDGEFDLCICEDDMESVKSLLEIKLQHLIVGKKSINVFVNKQAEFLDHRTKKILIDNLPREDVELGSYLRERIR